MRFSLDGWQGDRDFYYMMIREFGKLQYNIDTIKPQSTFVGDIYQSELLYLEYELPPVCHAKDFRLAFLSLPASKQNMAPEVWEFEPKLRAAQKEDTLPKNDQGFLSSEEHEGITMQILAYYETPKFTGLSYRFQTPSLRNSVSLLGGWNPSNPPMIVDSEGNNYYEQDRRSASSHFGYFSMVNKMPHDESFHLNSPSMMLYWNELDFEILENKAPITIDFSANFEKGHEWKLDFWYEYDYPHKIYLIKWSIAKAHRILKSTMGQITTLIIFNCIAFLMSRPCAKGVLTAVPKVFSGLGWQKTKRSVEAGTL